MYTMAVDKQQFVSWVNGAHTMEISIVSKLQDHAAEAREFPNIAEKLEEHTRKTKLHAEAMKGCVVQLGGTVSAAKDSLAAITGMIQAATDDLSSDLAIRNLLTDLGSEHYEIAYYKMLIAAAEEFGEQRVLNVCKDILKEEEEMAAWLEEQIPETVEKFIRNQK
jgi:ferritin-like metal-binding protein YciE